MATSYSKCHFLFLILDLHKPNLTKAQLSLSLSNPTPLTHKLFLHVLLASDPAREEMFCLILKCEVSCQVSLVTDLFGRGGKKKTSGQKENVCAARDSRVTVVRSKLMGGNWLLNIPACSATSDRANCTLL